LRQAVAARGIPVRLYVDKAKQFRSPQLARIAASIGMMVTHTPPYQPEGRGKIERYFRSVREQFLANRDPKRTLTLVELNDRLWAWLEQVYHVSEHNGLGTTPLLRWQRDIEPIRQLPPSTDLRRCLVQFLSSVCIGCLADDALRDVSAVISELRSSGCRQMQHFSLGCCALSSISPRQRVRRAWRQSRPDEPQAPHLPIIPRLFLTAALLRNHALGRFFGSLFVLYCVHDRRRY